MKFLTRVFSATMNGCVMMMQSLSGNKVKAYSTNSRLLASKISSMQKRLMTMALLASQGMAGSSPNFKFSTSLLQSPKLKVRLFAFSSFSASASSCSRACLTSESRAGLFFRYPSFASSISNTLIFQSALENSWQDTSFCFTSIILGVASFLIRVFFSSTFSSTWITLSSYLIPPKASRMLLMLRLTCKLTAIPFSFMVLPRLFRSMFLVVYIWPLSSQNSMSTFLALSASSCRKIVLISDPTSMNLRQASLRGFKSKLDGGLRLLSSSFFSLPLFLFAAGFLFLFLGLLSWSSIIFSFIFLAQSFQWPSLFTQSLGSPKSSRVSMKNSEEDITKVSRSLAYSGYFWKISEGTQRWKSLRQVYRISWNFSSDSSCFWGSSFRIWLNSFLKIASFSMQQFCSRILCPILNDFILSSCSIFITRLFSFILRTFSKCLISSYRLLIASSRSLFIRFSYVLRSKCWFRSAQSIQVEILMRPMALSPTWPTRALPSDLPPLFILLVRFCVAMRSAMKNSPNWEVSTSDCLLNISARSS